MSEVLRQYSIDQLVRNEKVPVVVFDINNLVAFTLGNVESLRRSGKWKISCMLGESRSVQWSKLLGEMGIDAVKGGAENFSVLQNIKDLVDNKNIRNFIFFATNENLRLSSLLRAVEFGFQDVDSEVLSQIRIYVVQATEPEVLDAVDEMRSAVQVGTPEHMSKVAEKRATDMSTGTYFNYRMQKK